MTAHHRLDPATRIRQRERPAAAQQPPSASSTGSRFGSINPPNDSCLTVQPFVFAPSDGASRGNPQSGDSSQEDWKSGLMVDRDRRVLGNLLNVVQAFQSPELHGAVAWDDFANRLVVTAPVPWDEDPQRRQWSDHDAIEFQLWLQRHGIPVASRKTVNDAVHNVGRKNSFDVLQDYLNRLKWDGVERLETWCINYLGSPDTELNRSLGRKFLISAVARGLRPGCKVDPILVLEGPQGIFKSRVIQVLGGAWTQEHLPDLHSKDAALALHGFWFVELSELAAFRKSGIESMKSFVSRQFDRYRPPYGHNTVDQPRRCCFVGTTNESRYLRDRTGNRRFWPIPCGSIRVEDLEHDRDQLFAEAKHAFLAGEAWWITEGEQHLEQLLQTEHEKRMVTDQWFQQVEEFVRGRQEVTNRELRTRFGITGGPESGPQLKRISNIMRRLGWVDETTKKGGTRDVIWRRTGESSKSSK